MENSLISMYFQDDAPYLRDLTRQFWEETLPHFEAYVSDIVLAEIRAIEDNNLRKGLERLIRIFIYLIDAYHAEMRFILQQRVLGEWNL